MGQFFVNKLYIHCNKSLLLNFMFQTTFLKTLPQYKKYI